MGWSEWKDFGGGGFERVALETFSASGTTGVSVIKDFDITSITDKYSELTNSNFFAEITTLECYDGTLVALSTFAKSYDPVNGTLRVRIAVKNNGGSSCRVKGNVYMVY